MRKILITTVLFASLAGVYSCKGKKANSEEGTSSATTATDSATKPAATSTSPEKTNETKTYTVTATPDSVILGKNKEAVIKIKNLKAIQLNDPDGKNTGIELTYDIEVTNKNKIGGGNVYVNPSQFRLLLDNATKLTHDTYNTVSADAESTKISTDNKFKLPAGTKPTALNVFFDETSASIKLELK